VGRAAAPEHHPEVDTGVHLMMVLDMCARLQAPLPVRFACLGHDLGKGTTPPELCCRATTATRRAACGWRVRWPTRLKVPTECRELAELTAREHGNVHRSGDLRRAAGAPARPLRRLAPARAFRQLLLACECDTAAGSGLEERAYEPRPRLWQVLQWARQVDTAAVIAAGAGRGGKGPEIAEAIHEARGAGVAQAGTGRPGDRGSDQPIGTGLPVR
jgi:tRNA nucleotidyltransferase (CCA-adding enzyme)